MLGSADAFENDDGVSQTILLGLQGFDTTKW